MSQVIYNGMSGIPLKQIFNRLKKEKRKPKKDIDISEASYCPKEKVGQSWAYTGGNKNE